jgi:MFS family permease
MSGVAGGVGTQLTAVAIGIQVYQLSGTTAAVALVGGLALAPMVVVGIFGGAVVDAFDRRKVLIVASSISFVAPLGIAVLSWLSVQELWPYYVFTTLSSTIGSLVGAARFAIHPRLVERRLLPAVAALSGISAGLQSAVGPALGGLLIAAVGFAWTYTIDLGLFLVGFSGIVSLPAIVPAVRARVGPAAIAEGLRFLRSARNLQAAIGIQIATFTFGRAYALLPAVGAVLLGGGATTVGILVASSAVGVVLSGVLSGPLGHVRQQGRAMLIAAACMAGGVAVFGALVLTLSLVPHGVSADRVDLPWLVAVAAALVLVGAADNVAGIFRTTMMQSAAPDEVRGRLQGLYTLVLTAGPRLGDVFAGFVAAAGVLWWPPLAGAVIIGIVLAAIVRARPAFRDYDAQEPVP